MQSRWVAIGGIFTALVTPFSSDGAKVDYDSLDRLISMQLAAGVSGVVACGSTAEAATLSDAEYVEVVRFIRERTRGRVPCISGISVSSTAKAVELAKVGQELGCDGLLLTAPPYNKPSQAGIMAHFKAVYAAVNLPIVGYNIPGRTSVTIAPATLGLLSKEGVIVGIKESSGSTDALADTVLAVEAGCQIVSGDDSLTLSVLAYGGVGAISAAANAIPEEMVAIVNAWRSGDANGARRAQMEALPRIRALFVESNPVPVKAVLAAKKVIAHPTVRLPLVPLMDNSREVVRRAFGV
ncbi:MAG: 4-hydroxy-tetrahydrodipicolinate synthase [Pseudomonadota bacterium]|jgi:4-hydroxy-tetrahydrodipicolinate synthase